MSPAPLTKVLARFRAVSEHPTIDGISYDIYSWHVVVDHDGMRKRMTVEGAYSLVMRGLLETSAIPDDAASRLQKPLKEWIVARSKQEKARLRAETAADAMKYAAEQEAMKRKWAVDEKNVDQLGERLVAIKRARAETTLRRFGGTA